MTFSDIPAAAAVFLDANTFVYHGLLTNDAIIVALMAGHGLANLASNDADFDRVPGITRFAPA
jgi:predicted nucleic acid-binding protein